MNCRFINWPDTFIWIFSDFMDIAAKRIQKDMERGLFYLIFCSKNTVFLGADKNVHVKFCYSIILDAIIIFYYNMLCFIQFTIG